MSGPGRVSVVVAAAGVVAPDPKGWSVWLTAADLVIAADGGLVHCARAERWPDVLVGDLDSAPEELVAAAVAAGVRVQRHDVDKDQTDLELALDLAHERGCTDLVVVGLLGGRVDHELANLSLILAGRFGATRVAAHDGLRSMWVLRGPNSIQLDEQVGTTLSLIPWGGDATGVVTAGLKWPLAHETLRVAAARGVSNRCASATQQVGLSTGVLLVVVDRSS